ncbi:MAG: histidinol-phosphate transaminase [Chitinophagales bacterium]|nr:histidinol-phosphate transaminase [Chitinophagales bacterium]
MKIDVRQLLRPHLRSFKAYSSARTEYTGHNAIFLDANENSFGSASGEDLNRYPDPLQKQVKHALYRIKGIPPENIFVGNGSDEAIDLLYRAFCEPGQDNVIICPPTYGMYQTSAELNNIQLKEVLLNVNFQLKVDEVLNAIDSHTKMIFLCSPNNPTGNLLYEEDITKISENFEGLVVIDEAYIDFSPVASWSKKLSQYPNMVVLQTLSKAWGMAAIRVGLAFASEEIIRILTAIKPPYNVSKLAQEAALKALNNEKEKLVMVEEIKEQRKRVINALKGFSYVKEIIPTDTNFVLIRVENPNDLYRYLTNHNVVVRNRDTTPMCKGGIRITIGTKAENDELLGLMQKYI